MAQPIRAYVHPFVRRLVELSVCCKSQGQFPESGAHRAPVFISRHEDYSPVKADNHVDIRPNS